MEAAISRVLGSLGSIWTYPVKSLRGVAHDVIDIADDGLAGDRRAALYVASEEHARSGKTYRGKEDNRLHLLDQPDDALRAVRARGVDLEVRAGERYFDAGPVSLIVDTWIAEVERGVGCRLDPLRWRPNLFVHQSGGDARSEKTLPGTRLAVGTAVLRVLRPIGRCVTPTYDQVTGESNDAILRFVALNRDNEMGIYCEVEQPGAVRVGDIIAIR